MVGRATPCAPHHMTFQRAEDCPPYRTRCFNSERVRERAVHRFNDLVR